MVTLIDMLVWFGTPAGELVIYVLLGLVAAILTFASWGIWTRTHQKEYQVLARYTMGLAIVQSLMVLLQGLVVGNILPPDLANLSIPPLLSALDTASMAFLCLACMLFIAPGRQRNARRFFRFGLLVAPLIYVITAPTWALDVVTRPDLAYGVQWQSLLGSGWQAVLGLVLMYLLARYATTQRNLLLVGFLIVGVGLVIGGGMIFLGPPWEAIATGWTWLMSLVAFVVFALAIYRHIIAQLARYVDEMARFGQDMQRRNRELFFLTETGRAIIGRRDLTDMLTRVIEHVVLALDAHAGAVFLLNELEPPRWHLCATYDSAGPPLQPVTVRTWSVEPILTSVPELRQAQCFQVAAEQPVPGLPADVQTALLQPLRIRDQVVGALVVGTRQPRAFSTADLSFCQTLTNQIAVAVENARLQNETSQRAAEMAMLHEVGRTITSSLDLEETTRSILTSVGRLIDYTTAEICLYDKERDVLTTQGAVGPHEKHTYQVGEGLTGWLAQHRQPKLIADVEMESQIHPKVTHVAEGVPLRAYVGVPLLIGDRLVGTLELAHWEPVSFDARDLRLLRDVAAQAAVAVENARLYSQTDEHLTRRVDELHALSRLGQELGALLDLDELLDVVARSAAQILRCPYATLFLVDAARDTQALEPVAAHGRTLDQVRDPRLVQGEGIAGWVAKHGTPVLVSDTTTDERFGPSHSVLRTACIPADEPWTLIAVPLLGKDRVIGVLSVDEPAPRVFAPADQVLLSTLADQTATAIENARLFKEHKERTLQAESLWRIEQAVNFSLELEPTLRTLVKEMAQLMGVAQSGIILFDDECEYGNLTVEYRETEATAVTELKIPLKGNPSIERILATQEPLAIYDAETDPLVAPIRDVIRRRHIKSILIIPLIARGEVIGTIGFDATKAPRRFTEEEIRLGQILAGRSAIAIENARLYEAERQQMAQTQALRETAQVVTSTLCLEDVCTRILEQLQTVVAYDSAALWLREGEQLCVVAGRGFLNLDEILKLEVNVADNPLFSVLAETRHPLVVDDTLQDERFLALGDTGYVRSWLGVPLVIQDEVIGSITIDQREPHRYTVQDGQLAMAFASQATVAIHNARLFENLEQMRAALQDAKEFSDGLIENANDIIYVHDLEGRLTLINRAAEELTGYSREEMIGQPFTVILAPEYMEETLAKLRAPRGAPILPYEAEIIARDGSRIPLEISMRPLEEEGRIVGAVGLARDIRERKAAEAMTQRRTQELAAQSAISTTLSQSLDLNEITQTMVREMARVFDVEQCGLVLFAHGYGELVAQERPPDVADRGRVRVPLTNNPSMERIMETQQPLYIADVETDPLVADLREVLRQQDIRSMLLIPLISKGQVIGTVGLDSLGTLRTFTDEDIRLAQSLANQAAVAIENARLYEQTDAALAQRIKELSAIEEIDRQLSSTLDYERVIELVLDNAMRATGAEAGMIALSETEGEVLTVLAARGYPDELPIGRSWRTDQGVVGRVTRTGRPALIADVTQEPDYVAVVAEARAELAVPILREDRVLGVLNMESPAVGAFREEHLSFVEHLAEHAGIAIENARLFAETQRRAEEMASLFEILAIASSTLDLDDVLPRVMDRTLDLLSAEKGTVLLFDEARQELVAQHIASVGATPEQVIAFRIPADSENFQYGVFSSGRSYRTVDAQTDPRILPAYRSFIAEFDVHTLLGVPLRVADRIIGEMYVTNKREGAFTEDDERLLSTVAAQFAAVIENTRLYRLTDEALEKRVSEFLAIQRIGQELNATLNLEQVLSVLIQEAINATRSNYGNVVLRDLETGRFSVAIWHGYTGEEAAALRALTPDEGEGLTAQVMRSGQPALVRDVREKPGPADVKPETRAALAVPVFYVGDVVGAINLCSLEPEAFRQEDLAFVRALADQASVAIGNAQRYQEQVQQAERLRQRADQLAGVLEVGNVLRTDLSLDEILTEVAYAITEGTSFSVAAISVVEGDPPTLRRVAGAGMPIPTLREWQAVRQPLTKFQPIMQDEFRISQSYFVPRERSEVLRDWHVVTLPELAVEEREEGEWQSGDEFFVPMRGTDGAFLGYISLDDPRDRQRPTRRVVEGLEIFANQAAIAIENARLFASLERQVETQRGLLDVATALQGVLDSRRIYEVLADYLGRMFDFVTFTCYEVDWKTRMIRPAYTRGLDSEEIMAETFSVEEGITGHVAHSGQAEIVPHVLSDPRAVQVAGTPEQLESMLVVPLLARDTVLGVMNVYRLGDRSFTDEEFAIAKLFANQAAAVVENARLFEETQRRLRELAALNEMALALSATLDLKALVEMIYRQTARVMDAANFYIALYDPEREMVSFPIAVEGGEHVEEREDFAPRRRGQGLTEYIIDTGLPVLVERDVGGWLEAHDIAIIGPLPQSCLGVPLYVGERTAGVITVQSYERAAAYDEGHMSLLSTVAAQAAVALDNARLFEETQRRLVEMAALNKVGQAISSALDLDELLAEVYRQAGALVDTTNFYIALHDAERDIVSFPISVDEYDPIRPPRPAGAGLTGHIIHTRQPLLIRENMREAHRRIGIEPSGHLAKSWLGVPMLAGDKVLGVIAVQSYHRERAYDESHLEVLSTLAAQTAVAIENTYLYDQARARMEEMINLYGISLATSSTTDVKQALQFITDGALALTGAAVSTVSLPDPHTGQLVQRAVSAESTRLLGSAANLRPRPGGLSAHVLESRQPAVIPDTAAEPRFNPETRAAGIQAAAGVPLLLRDQAVGVLFVNYTETHAFSEWELQVLFFLASQAAIAIENARLFEEIRLFSQELEQRVEERTAELATEKEHVETLHQITSELATTLDLDQLLNRTLEQLGRVSNAERGAILWVDPRQERLVYRAAYGRQEELPIGGKPTAFRSGVGLAGWAIQHRQAVLSPDVRADERWVETDPESKTRSMMVVPIVAGDDVLGVATLSHPHVAFFTKDQLRLVSTIIGEVGIAAHNAELYIFVREQADRMAQLYRTQEAEASKLGAILESIADGVIVSDARDRIILANKAAEWILETQMDILAGQEVYRVMGGIFGEDEATFQELRRELVSGQQFLARVFEWEGKVINAHIAPVFTEKEEFVGLVTVFRDITKEHEVDRMKTEFVSTVSHELRTPLTSIKGYVDLILDGDAGEINDDVREFLITVQSNSDRLAELINDLLDISRIETGRLRLDLEPTSLPRVMNEVLDSVRAQVAARQLTLQVDLPPDLPPVYADMQRLHRVLLNLVTNAYKYTPPGGTITITAQVVDDGYKVQVDVADTGIGISEVDQQRLFSRFFRADHPLVRAASGTGLGLAIARSLVDLHGGEMWMTSELDKGSAFSFTIPLAETEEQLAAAELGDES